MFYISFKAEDMGKTLVILQNRNEEMLLLYGTLWCLMERKSLSHQNYDSLRKNLDLKKKKKSIEKMINEDKPVHIKTKAL